MQEIITQVIEKCGYLGVCFLIAVENLFPPIPSEVILTFGGFMTTCTRLSVPGVIVFSTIGSVIGALILYRIGMEMTPKKLENLYQKSWFRRLGFERENIENTVSWFQQHGKAAVLVGRCIPIIRSLISVPAGMTEMNFPLFLIYTVAGSTVWNCVLVSAGAALGNSWDTVLPYMERYSGVVKGALAVLAGAWIIKKVRQRVGS